MERLGPGPLLEPRRGYPNRTGPQTRRGCYLLEFRQAVNDAKSEIISKLDLDHLGRELLAHLANFLRSELHLSATSLDQMIDEQRGQVLRLFVTGMPAHVEDLRHRGTRLHPATGTYGRACSLSTMPRM
jgi:hypothetical protein